MSTPESAAQENQEKSFFGIIVHSFFVIPFLIAVFCLLLFAAVHLLTSERQTVYDFLEDIKTGGETKRWQAAFELSKILANPDLIPDDERFTAEMIKAYQKSATDDSRVRQYLALAMGRTGKGEFFTPLSEQIGQDKDENLPAVLYALGMLKDKRAVPVLAKFVTHPDPRVRSIVVVSLGNIEDLSSKEILKNSLNDPEPNVQWGSALSLAKLRDASGRRVIEKLLDREYLAKFPEVDAQEQNHLMLAAIDAVKTLKLTEFKERLRSLADSDKNMKVRAAALEYLQN